MIDELRITNLGVIDEATIDLHPGFTVVTGETGAGKTMIVTGIGLLLGLRADPRAVRTGADNARVEGRFADVTPELVSRVEEAGGELDGEELLVARQITAAGRSRAWLGGAQVPLGTSGAVTAELVSIYGQSEQAELTWPDRQRSILDAFAGPKLSGVLTRYRQRYAERQLASAELDQLRTDAQARAREIDLLQFGLDEIEQVDPQPGEDVALAAEAQRLQSVDDLRLAAQAALSAVAGGDADALGATSALAIARKQLEQASAQDAQAEDLAKRSAELSYLVDDFSADLARYLDGLDAEPGRLEWIAARRSALAGLTRKYGSSCDEVLAWSEESVRRLTGLSSSDERIETLTGQIAALDAELKELAETITKQRMAAAKKFSKSVLAELSALAMPHATLIFDLRTTAALGPHGRDQVELLFSANPGTEPRSLSKVASGGELSRVRLALEVVLADDTAGRTLVFDEVDAGVGGSVAVEIGRRLASLATRAQVIVVTHLAQVAAFADRHFVVIKANDGQVTTSGVAEVHTGQRAEELARMMAGLETSDSALAHAAELVAVADEHRRALAG